MLFYDQKSYMNTKGPCEKTAITQNVHHIRKPKIMTGKQLHATAQVFQSVQSAIVDQRSPLTRSWIKKIYVCMYA